MSKKKAPTKNTNAALKSIRTSVSLPYELHETLEQMAKKKKVSTAWVIRDAAEKYIAEQWPLLQKDLL